MSKLTTKIVSIIVVLFAVALIGYAVSNLVAATPAYTGKGEVVNVDRVLRSISGVYGCDVEYKDEAGNLHTGGTYDKDCGVYTIGETVNVENGYVR